MKISLSVLKKRYKEWEENKTEIIEHKGLKFVPAYLKYLIQYLEGEYKRKQMRETEKVEVVPQ